MTDYQNRSFLWSKLGEMAGCLRLLEGCDDKASGLLRLGVHAWLSRSVRAGCALLDTGTGTSWPGDGSSGCYRFD